MPRRFKNSVAEHSTYGFNWYSVTQCHRRGKSVPRYMKCKIEMNTAPVGYCF